MKRALFTAFVLVGACNQSASAQQNQATTTGVDRVGQRFTIEVDVPAVRGRFPETSNMRMAGFDAAAYVRNACILYWRSARCEVFAQLDPTGALSGYLVLVDTENDGNLFFDTDTMTTPRSVSSRQCALSGSLEISEGDARGDFRARSQFETTGSHGGIGVIYLWRSGNNIQVTDERWNYCYQDRHIDDVYNRVGTFVRTLDRARWPSVPH